MENLTQTVTNIFLQEKEACNKRAKNNEKSKELKAQKQQEIDNLEKEKEKIDEKIEKLETAITNISKNLIVPMEPYLLFSKDTDFLLPAEIVFYNPNEGNGDPHWRSSDRKEFTREALNLKITNISFFFVNNYSYSEILKNNELLNERTNLFGLVTFQLYGKEVYYWVKPTENSLNIFSFVRENLDWKGKTETNAVWELTFTDPKDLLKTDKEVALNLSDLYEICDIPAKPSRSVNKEVIEKCRNLLSLQPA